MKIKFLLSFYSIIVIIGLASIPIGCVHDPFPITKIDPVDTLKDTVVINPPIVIIDTNGSPCDPNKVYFEKDVMPILRQNCAISGCHAAGTYQDGVNLENYESIISKGKTNKWIKVVTTTETDEIMPPLPNAKLSASQISTLTQWINSGAKNETCNPNYGKPLGCKSEGSTYSGFVKNVIAAQCISCHKTSNKSGGINLDSYDNVKINVANGKLLGSITWNPSFVSMPYKANKLDTCTINNFKYWINNGAKND